jgi:uncharacterized protein (UPF0332 family)
MIAADQLFLEKAEESLDGADSEWANRRYNNAANRCYYACFQAAIYALVRAGIHPSGQQGEWGHAFVQARFVGDLVNRRKLYPSSLRDVLSSTMRLRHKADYQHDRVSETQATRAIRNARQFVEAVRRGGEAP